MQPQPDIFLHFTATGWTAVSSIVGIFSIIVLSWFNLLSLRAALRATKAAEKQATVGQDSLKLLRSQLALTQRPFVAVSSTYSEEIKACLIFAHNQGNGPALDVEAHLVYKDGVVNGHSYSIGCLPIDGRFQFLIGESSNTLTAATIWYTSISGESWTTEIALIAGHPYETVVLQGFKDDEDRRLKMSGAVAKAIDLEQRDS